jgi:hypothetical protein
MEVETTKLTTFVIGLAGLIILPIGFIWASNTIFQFNLEYTFINWLAVLFLQLYFQVVVKASTTPGGTKSKK